MPSTPSRCRRAAGATRRARRRAGLDRRRAAADRRATAARRVRRRASAPDDHDRRMEALLGNGDTQSAARSLMWAPARKRALYEARLALQTRAADAASRLAVLDPVGARDPGLVIDRANWLRNTGQSAAARALLAGRPRFDRPPANAEALAGDGADPGARRGQRPQLADRLRHRRAGRRPLPGRHRRQRPALWRARRLYEPRLARRQRPPCYRLGRPADAARLFELYARAARSPQTRAKGFYWAARAAARAGKRPRPMPGSSRRRRAPTSFTASSRSSGSAGRRRRPPASPPADPADARRLRPAPAGRGDPLSRHGRAARATRPCSSARWPSSSRTTASGRSPAEFGRQIGRLDLGVWAAREARNRGREFLRPRRLPRSPDPARLPQPLGGRPRHHPPGKLVRADRGQPGRRARHDAADARHRADEARRRRRPLQPRPADRGSRTTTSCSAARI